ncbi:MAG: hypothetical protein WCQ95_01720 [Bacteroidota bacterium]
MKRTTRIIISIFLVLTALFLTIKSLPSYEQGRILLYDFSIIILGGLLLSLTYAVWSKKNRNIKFIVSFEVTFGISALVFIIGYLYISLQPIILK